MAISRIQRASRAIIVAGIGACLLSGSAAAATTKPASTNLTTPDGVDAQMKITPNWAGYVARAPVKSSYLKPYFTSVTGTWTVPNARCTKPKAKLNPLRPYTSSTVWIGLGGYATRDQEEVGTDSNCTVAGKPRYYAWFEVVPYLSYKAFPTIENIVKAGDTMTGLVKVVNPRKIMLQIQDRTRNWTFKRTIGFSSQDTSTADWIVEAPATCIQYNCAQASLANFGDVTMRDISATARGKKGTLLDPRWKVLPLRLVPSRLIVPTISDSATAAGPGGKKGKAKSPAGATPGPVSHDGSSFSMHWVARAKPNL